MHAEHYSLGLNKRTVKVKKNFPHIIFKYKLYNKNMSAQY